MAGASRGAFPNTTNRCCRIRNSWSGARAVRRMGTWLIALSSGAGSLFRTAKATNAWLGRREGEAMANQRLINEVAWMMARELAGKLNLAREEQFEEAVREFFRVCQAGLGTYEVHATRMQQRLR